MDTTSKTVKVPMSSVVGVLAALAVSLSAQATPNLLNQWENQYPASQSAQNLNNGGSTHCQLCHAEPSGGPVWNGYGWQLRTNLNDGMSITEAILAAEPFNSDADPYGCDNITEIMADTQPGWTIGANNTVYLENGETMEGQSPPADALGHVDPAEACCPEDIDGSGFVDIADLLLMLSAWGPNSGDPADLNGDGEVAVGDLLQLLAAWGEC